MGRHSKSSTPERPSLIARANARRMIEDCKELRKIERATEYEELFATVPIPVLIKRMEGIW